MSDPLDDLILNASKTEQERNKLRSSMAFGMQQNPDERSRAQQVAKKLGTTPQAAQENLSNFERAAKQKAFDFDGFIKNTPKLSTWASNPENAAIAHDDLEVLTGLESASEKAIIMARNAASVRNRMMGKTGAMAEVYSTGAHANKATWGFISSVLSAAGESADFAAYSVQELVKGIVAGPDAFDRAMRNITSVRPSEIGGLGSAFTKKVHEPLMGVFESGTKARAPLMVQLPDGSTTYNWKEIGAYWDLIVENAPQLATQWGASVKAFNVAKMAGATDAVAAAKAAAVARPIEWSQTFAQEMEATRKSDVPMLRGLATAAASSTAQTMISQGLPGGKGGLDALLFRRIAESAAGKKGIAGAAQRGALGFIKEGTEESFQEGVSVLGQRTYDPNALQGAVGRILTAGIGGALVGGPIASIAFRDNIREISDLAEQSKLKARDAEAFAGFMKEVGGEAFIDANKLTTFFQENGIDPIQGADMVGARNYAEAMVAGTDAVVSVADLVSKLKPEQVSALADDLRMAQGELSAREVEDYQEQSAKVDLEKAAEPAEAGPRQAIAENTYRQLVDAGMAPRVAEVYADRHARVMENLAKDYGQDPIALNERYGLRIMRVDPSVSPVDAVLSDGRKVDLTSESGMEAYLAENPEADPLYWQAAYHGSPYRFDKFTLDHIGKGEGAQAYGWGLYFAGNKEVAEYYRKALGGKAGIPLSEMRSLLNEAKGGSPFPEQFDGHYEIRRQVRANPDDSPEGIAKKSQYASTMLREIPIEKLAEIVKKFKDADTGQTYKVDIPEDGKYLLWDKPLSEQPEAVKAALESLPKDDKGRMIMPNGEHWAADERATGESLYRAFTEGKGTDEQASRELNTLGLAGIKYEDGNTRGSGGEKSYNYVIFDANAVKTIETYYQSAPGDGSRAAKMSARMRKLARTTRAAMDKSMAGEVLANEAEFAAFDEAVKGLQAGDILESKRGFIQFSPERKVSIAFLENADLTTFIHETGHMYLEVAGDLAQESPDSEGAKQYAKILNFLGVESRDAISREHQEKFAEAMEAYAMEGKAPTPELRSTFERVKYWMLHVYRSLSALNVKLNDEIRSVFDRMIAGDDAVSMTERALELKPMFANAEDMGSTQAEFDAYTKMAGKATMTAREAVEAKLMRELMREREAWWKDEFAKVSEEVAAELETAPGYVAFRALTQGEDGVKLSKQALLDAGMTQEDLNALPRSKSRVYSLEGGMDPQSAAEVLGFQNGGELLDTLRELKPFKEQVKEVSEARMKEKHGDMINDGTIADEAIEAVHNGHYADLRMAELRVLERMRRQAKPAVEAATKQIKAQARDAQAGMPPIQAFRDTAKEIVERTAIRDIQPHRYLQARVKASKDAAKAYTALDFEAASEAKRREILNHFLYLEASRAREESTKIAEYARNATDKKFLQRLGKAGADYLGQWLNLAGRYDFTRISKEAIDQNIRDWAAAKEAEGIVIDPVLFDESRVKNWREIPIVELRALHDALVNIETVARRARKVIAGDKQVDYEIAVGDLVSQAYGNFKAKALPLDDETRTYVEKAISYAKKWNVELLKFEEVVDRLDKGDINGPWRRYVFEPMASAQYREFELNRKMTLLLNEAMEEMPKGMRRALSSDVTLEGIGTVKRKYLLSMALNMGNESNQSKMLRGMGWADPAGMENVGKALDKLTREEWTFVQKTWDALESLWPEIAALEKRMTGLDPEKVERTPFTVTLEDGTTLELQGGYYPVAYDPKRSSFGKMQADADIMTPEGLYRGPHTFKGHTKERNEAANAPMLFDFEQVLSKHVPRVVKDVSHREAAMSVAKLLNNQEVRRAVQETLGPEYEAAMMPWLQGTVNDPAGASTELASWLGKARSNLVVASLAFRASSVLVQVMDPVRALVGEHAVKPQYMLGASAKLSADLARFDLKTIRDIRAMSGEMEGRKENLDRDLRSMWKRNLGKTGFYAETQRAGMKGLAIADALTSTVVWLGAYDQAIAEGAEKSKAIRMADRVVRLKLMTGAAKDLTKLQRSPDMASKLVTTYIGDAVSVYGMLSRSVHNVANGEKIAASAFAFLMAGMILPVLADAVKGKAPEDDEDKAAWALRKAAFGLPSSIPLVRDVAGSMESGYNYSFSPIASQIAKIPKFAKKYSGDKDIDEESLALDVVDLVGGFAGLPGTGQAMTSLRYLKAVEEGRKPEPKSGLKKTKNIVLGPAPERKR